jgi:MATE family multidrug resistance protein
MHAVALAAGRRLPRRDHLRATVRLALPVVVIQVGMMAMGVVDTIMVGHLSPQALAAVALGNLYFFAAIFPWTLRCSSVVAQAVGARDSPRGAHPARCASPPCSSFLPRCSSCGW